MDTKPESTPFQTTTRTLLVVVFSLFCTASSMASAQTAAQRMSKPGPEEEQLTQRAGVWDVVATLWPAPGAEPIVSKGLIAERTMIGPLLQEIMRPAPGSATPDFRRIDFLTYDRVEGRWKYVSMDTRFPVSIMPAWSFGGERNGVLTLYFEPLAFVGFGKEVEGRMMRSDMVITHPSADHELKQQHFVMADGTGKEWLAVQYEYTRRTQPK
ncbi:MAG TPA: DUF1579 family protein [Thermoanaerobaculia bacterium]|jgi:hypothetical protein|nr:DUF1579 family protein [Thermoanaerobaculia bacterium]